VNLAQINGLLDMLSLEADAFSEAVERADNATTTSEFLSHTNVLRCVGIGVDGMGRVNSSRVLSRRPKACPGDRAGRTRQPLSAVAQGLGMGRSCAPSLRVPSLPSRHRARGLGRSSVRAHAVTEVLGNVAVPFGNESNKTGGWLHGEPVA
jgi:hypothetical protein